MASPASTEQPVKPALIQELAELAALRRVPQLLERLRLDLAYPLTRDLEVPAHLFESARVAVIQAEAHLQHLALARRQLGQHVLDLLAQDEVARRLGRRD